MDSEIIIAGDFNDFEVSVLQADFILYKTVIDLTRGNNILDQILISESLCEHYQTADVGPPLSSRFSRPGHSQTCTQE